ncbi:MAG: c-type cytochrome biogenesis protein CcmI, partial [Pseudomonadota bacterium]
AQAREFANRPNQAMAEAAFAASPNAPPTVEIPQETLSLLAQLREVLKERSTDLRGHQLLANNLAQLGQWSEAHAAQRKVIELQGDAAPGRDFVSLAEYQILAAGGYVSPEAETALANGLQRSPTDPRGRYYSGLLLAQGGRPDLAFEIWVRLLREGPADAPWLPAIQAQLPEVASAAGKMVPGALLPDSPVGRGPNAEAMEAAQDLSPAERQEMIQGMVAGLANRLATEGGPPEDWARLIRAYGVLGEMRQASDIWNEAREVFADAPAALGMIRRAAQDAQVIQ